MFIANWPFGSVKTVPLAFSVQGPGTAPSARTTAGLPVPQAKSPFRFAGKTGTLGAQLNAGPGMEITAVLTACGFWEAGITSPLSL